MLLFPEVSKIAQQEIDRICGPRLPTLDDNLPYVRCCVKESMRWMPTALLGVPHALTRDDDYMGYRLPKDASVIMNVWTLNHNVERYPNPRRFEPSRYAHDKQTAAEAALNADVTMRDHFLFGAGRRLCQGTHIAERSLFLGISRLLWAFDFTKAVDESGIEITPDPAELTEGALVQPKPFPANIRPRSREKVDAILQEWKKMEPLLDEEGQWKTLPEGMIWKEYKTAARAP